MKRFPPKWKALKAASLGRLINKRSGRLAEHYRCAECLEPFVARDVQVDHINPVVDPAKGFEDWPTYMERLYCEADNLQVLCKPCHKDKTNEERKERKKK